MEIIFEVFDVFFSAIATTFLLLTVAGAFASYYEYKNYLVPGIIKDELLNSAKTFLWCALFSAVVLVIRYTVFE